MGNWNITINGIGSHHNADNALDADRLARAFAEHLLAAGHTVDVATFTHGGKEDLLLSQAFRGPEDMAERQSVMGLINENMRLRSELAAAHQQLAEAEQPHP